jgi:hypothetical protein
MKFQNIYKTQHTHARTHLHNIYTLFTIKCIEAIDKV